MKSRILLLLAITLLCNTVLAQHLRPGSKEWRQIRQQKPLPEG